MGRFRDKRTTSLALQGIIYILSFFSLHPLGETEIIPRRLLPTVALVYMWRAFLEDQGLAGGGGVEDREIQPDHVFQHSNSSQRLPRWMTGKAHLACSLCLSSLVSLTHCMLPPQPFMAELATCPPAPCVWLFATLHTSHIQRLSPSSDLSPCPQSFRACWWDQESSLA